MSCPNARKAVFLDRDGTIVRSVYRPDLQKHTAPFRFEELEFADHLEEALATIRRLGYLVIIVTNQPDVAYGYITQTEWERIQKTVIDKVGADDVFVCHHPRTSECPYRKPSPGMLFAAASRWAIDLTASFMVGDTDMDVLAGIGAGCTTLLIDAEYNQDVHSDYRVPGLLTAATLIEMVGK